MLLWFLGFSMVAMWVVFRDPAIDHRTVLAGAVLPLVVDLPTGRAGVGHALLAPVVLLVVVMGATVRRRAARRRWLGLAIGAFLHLVLDAAWTEPEVFWWPAFGFSPADTPTPVLARSTVTLVLQELAGAGALLWAAHRFGLSDPGRRARFLRTGRIDRSVTDPPGAAPPC